ncbi:hypothetical protein C8A00DRAFT_16562 [Chaetomidium leptoderma]|uniref:Malic acid transport protein n=1 Tax=Chaetomidium leptoderma TaxID=669021 RepID=A0AAN6ZV55_9PEZI|nr:hypothetical protein C8A00DRAFT_16562 [Chaetomidium leptoderma]
MSTPLPGSSVFDSSPESNRPRLQRSHSSQEGTDISYQVQTPSGRSSADYNDSHLDDLEKSLPIDTIPSLHLQSLHSQRGSSHDNKTHETGPPPKTKSITPAEPPPPQPRLSIRARLAHFTWAWYTLTMSTGGLALLIQAQPHAFPGLSQIGLAVYVVNIVVFVLVTTALAARFALFRGTLVRSLTHPREGFFFPTFFLSLATLITSTQRYCVPPDPEVARDSAGRLLGAIRIAFWIYVALTTSVAVGQYSYVFATTHSFGLQTMMPTWILPIFPIMLSGTIASVISETQPAASGVSIVVAGLTCQGLGIAVAFMMYAHMVGRLMQSGLPNREHRTGLFMCVGPPAFTALAFIGMARGLPENFDHDMDGLIDTNFIETLGLIGAGFLWALSFWWFGIAILAVAQSPPKHFHLGWWAAVFPNTGFTLATISLGAAFQNDAILWFSTAMSILLVLTYLFVLYHHVRAVIVQDIMYPGRDEDVEDH